MSSESKKKWKKANPEKTKLSRKRNYAVTQRNARNYREAWTIEHMRMIMARDMLDRDLSRIIGRSVQAIQLKRCKLKAKEVTK